MDSRATMLDVESGAVIIGSLFIVAIVGCYASLVFALTHGNVRRGLLAIGTVVTALLVLVLIGFVLNPG